MKIEKEPEGTWTWRLSLKLGQNNAQMLNIRASSWDDFNEALQNLSENRELLQEAAGAFDKLPVAGVGVADARALPPALVEMAATPAPAPRAPAQVKAEGGQQIGPVTVQNYSASNGIGKNGRPWTRHTVTFAGGVKASTFDSLLADVAQQLIGKPAFATVEKSKFGYELLNVRPAA